MVFLGLSFETERHVEEKAGQLELIEGMEETVTNSIVKKQINVGIFFKSNY